MDDVTSTFISSGDNILDIVWRRINLHVFLLSVSFPRWFPAFCSFRSTGRIVGNLGGNFRILKWIFDGFSVFLKDFQDFWRKFQNVERIFERFSAIWEGISGFLKDFRDFWRTFEGFLAIWEGISGFLRDFRMDFWRIFWHFWRIFSIFEGNCKILKDVWQFGSKFQDFDRIFWDFKMDFWRIFGNLGGNFRILKGFSGFLKDFLKRFHVKEHQFIPVVSC